MPTFIDNLSGKTITVIAVSQNTAADHTLVSAVSGKKIYITEVMLIPDANSVKITFKSGATVLTGVMNLSTAGNVFYLPPVYAADGVKPHFVTAENEAFVLTLNAAVAVTGFISYYTE